MSMQQMQETLNRLLVEHHDVLDTRVIVFGQEIFGDDTNAALVEYLGSGPWLVAVDAHTWDAAGEDFARTLDASGISWSRYDVPDAAGEDHPICSDEAIAAYQMALGGDAYTGTVAVGAGTINDIVKMAAHLEGVPMACVATAPSMNGYTSKIAAILSNGVKTTNACTAPRVIVADIDVLAESPERMIASGLGDLISKPVSNADWAVSAALNGTFHSAEAMAVIELGASMLDGVAPKLPERDRDAVAGLVGSLMISGLAMSIAGSSSPASGGEHLISHFIDMTAFAYDQPYDFHGCQVGVGTLTTAHLYERLAAMNPDDIDVDARVAALPSWEDYDALLQERFGKLYGAVVKHTRPAYPTPEVLRARLTTLKESWSAILERAQRTLRTRESIEQELRAANGPVRFAELSVARARARQSITWSKDIRNRYTILHLAWELGHLDEWADEAMGLLYE